MAPSDSCTIGPINTSQDALRQTTRHIRVIGLNIKLKLIISLLLGDRL